ncbi:hypothetical protein F6R98_09095 [Candidatus Methylospira mobilis]|uniref:Uncharacterized protein n=1 Tax=Candidatus Methylospira mobilis TaxID=1808979 RepID=A0A5Q0BGU5_9GAMM|nr:hypothetical protein [Candidatus Methylospira mobilis]QFY42759.1 hypothetical protein F6R98_09095 [Candidatus Methylospira mobilis]
MKTSFFVLFLATNTLISTSAIGSEEQYVNVMNLPYIEYFVNKTDHGDELTNHIKFERIGVTKCVRLTIVEIYSCTASNSLQGWKAS